MKYDDKMKLSILGQEILLHITISSESPIQLPAGKLGDGLVQVLLLFLKPPAQVKEHSAKVDHSDQFPITNTERMLIGSSN